MWIINDKVHHFVGDTSQVLTEDEFIAEAILISVTESNINRGKFNKFNRLNEFIVCVRVSFFKNWDLMKKYSIFCCTLF